MTENDLQEIRRVFREELSAMLQPKKLPFNRHEFEQAVRTPHGEDEYFRNHELPDEVKYG